VIHYIDGLLKIIFPRDSEFTAIIVIVAELEDKICPHKNITLFSDGLGI
jgi:hypothetical protein